MADKSFPTGTLMAGKRGLIMGVANKNSIAWAIAQQLAAQGAELAFTYQGDKLLRRVKPLAESVMPKGSNGLPIFCLLYTSPSPRDQRGSRMPSSA